MDVQSISARRRELANTDHLPAEQIERSIVILRGLKVLLDHDLARMYGVDVRTLIQSVKRNAARFPEDFMFRLTAEEVSGQKPSTVIARAEPAGDTDPPDLRSQSVISRSWGGRRYLPHAFTEQGVAMLSSDLRSPRAVQVNIEIMRAFVRLRRLLETNAELSRKLAALEAKYDRQFRVVFDAIRELMTPPDPPARPIGFGRG
jgi:hypothetical protein